LIRLPKKYKVPLVLRYYKQMSYSEIAHALKSRLSAVRMMIFRGKEQLRHNLRHEQSGKHQPTQCRHRATGPLRELGEMMGPLVVGEPSHLKPLR
jgi:Sigma-70, region 4